MPIEDRYYFDNKCFLSMPTTATLSFSGDSFGGEEAADGNSWRISYPSGPQPEKRQW